MPEETKNSTTFTCVEVDGKPYFSWEQVMAILEIYGVTPEVIEMVKDNKGKPRNIELIYTPREKP